jgi:hypothetical protein
MISHKHKCIFIHIPKCAGSSIFRYFNPDAKVNWKVPNYEVLYGWCPKRKIHLQHATSKQLIETELISEEQWKTYFKFAFIRNPWDRALSDYNWIQKDIGIKGSFKEFILRDGPFKTRLRDNTNMYFRGDHLISQSSFFDSEGVYKLDFIGRFENLQNDINKVKEALGVNIEFNEHQKKSKKIYNHYSIFYTKSKRQLIEEKYLVDIERFGYSFRDEKKGLQLFKNYI